MPLNPADFPPTPHSVVWQPRKDGLRGGNANDGSEDSATEGGEINVYVEPRSAEWAERAYRVVTDKQHYLVVGKVETMSKLVKGDLLTFGDIVLKVAMKPQIFPPFNGFQSGETVAIDESTGGRP